MPCCRCNGSGARCRGCSCAKGKKSCIDCYPGRKGKCVNSQTSSQPPLLILSPSCSSDHASQSLLPPLLSTTPPPPPEHCLSPDPSQSLSSLPQSLQLPTHITPCLLPLLIGFNYGIGLLPLTGDPGILRTIPQLLQIRSHRHSCCCLNHSCLKSSCHVHNRIIFSYPRRHLQVYTIHHIPQKARPSFARVLSDTLRSICISNSEEAWLKLFMLPKCVLRASHRGGRRHKSHSIEELYRRWSDGHLASLWKYASDHARKSNSKQPKEQTKESDKEAQSAVSKARERLLGKACKVLTSSGIAPNTSETWNLIQQKHPIPTIPDITLPSETSALPTEFNIMSVLHSFPRDTACGPSAYSILLMLLRCTCLSPSVIPLELLSIPWPLAKRQCQFPGTWLVAHSQH